jgi:hypothetical protein
VIKKAVGDPGSTGVAGVEMFGEAVELWLENFLEAEDRDILD